MSKSIKFFPILLISFSLILSFYSVIYASNINMNLASGNSISGNIVQNGNDTLAAENTLDEPATNLIEESPIQTSSPSSVTATTEEGLGLSNVLSIILITVGVVLILLAIAIIIRLK